MRTILSCANVFAILAMGFTGFLQADDAASLADTSLLAVEAPIDHATLARTQMQASAISTQAWLDLVDKNQYGESWEQASIIMKRTVSKKEWDRILDAVRKPLGNVIKRQLAQQLPAQNPKHMPKGDYMVILYQTSFSNKPNAKELITLSYERGQWRVITYMIN